MRLNFIDHVRIFGGAKPLGKLHGDRLGGGGANGLEAAAHWLAESKKITWE